MSGDPPASQAAPADRRAGFRRFWAAATVSNLGDGVRLAALPLLAVELTTDARLISAVTALSLAPWVVVGPFAGVLADRVDRRTMMVAAQLARGISVLVLAIAVNGGRAHIAVLLGVALIVGVGETIVDSASQAAVPNLVDDAELERTNAQLSIAENLFNDVIGIALGAALFASAASAPFFVDAASFLIGGVLLAGISRPFQQRRPTAPGTIRGDVAGGIRYVATDRFLGPLALSVAVTNVAVHMGLAVMVILVVQELGASATVYGVVLGCGAAGGVVGSFAAGRLIGRYTSRGLLRRIHALFLIATVVYSVSRQAWMVSAAYGMTSAAHVLYQVTSRVLRQRATPDEIHGRVVSAFRMIGLSGPVLGAALGGLITQQFSVRWAYILSIGVMGGAWALTFRAARAAPEPSDTAAAHR